MKNTKLPTASALLLLLTLGFASCGSKSESNTTGSDSTNTNTAVATSWNKDDEGEFLAGCIENTKESMGEEKSFSYCKCLLTNVKKSFPSLDSAAKVLTDTTVAARYTEGCK